MDIWALINYWPRGRLSAIRLKWEEVVIHSSAARLSEFKTLTCCCFVGSCSCSLNNFPLVPELRLPLLRRHCVGVQRSTCDFVPTFHGFVRSAMFLHALTIVCVLFPSICTSFEIVVHCLPKTMFCGLLILACLTEVPCQTSSPDLVLVQTASANYYLRRCFFQRVRLFLLITPAE